MPVVVTVHGNQQCEAEATIFWDNAFAEKVRGYSGYSEMKIARSVSYIPLHAHLPYL